MERKTFTKERKAAILREHLAGKSAKEITAEHGVSPAAFYRWRKEKEDAGISGIARRNELETENRRLKAEVEKLTLELKLAKETIGKKP